MKEATGELSMTAIVVVIIGVIAVAAPPIVKSVINSAGRASKCSAAYGCTTGGDDGRYKCFYMNDAGSEETINCSSSDIGLTDKGK